MKLTFDVPDELVDTIKTAIENYTKQQVWPKAGDDYYFVLSDGSISQDSYSGCSFERARFEFGNIFKTLEEAEFKAEQLRVLHELEQLADDDQIDAYNDYHYMLIYDFDKSAVKINDIICAGFMFGTHYFKTKESAQAAINKIGETRLKKYYFCVPEGKKTK